MYDRTRLGFEQYMANKNISDRLISSAVKITPFSDKILYEDNDGDTIPNKDDPYPDEPFDDRFEIVQDYNYEPSIDFVDRHYENSQQCYGKINNPNITGRAIALLTVILHDDRRFGKWISGAVNQTDVDFGLHPERALEKTALPHAFDAFRHYFWGSGEPVYYSEADTCELISSSVQNLTHLFNNIDLTMRCAEGILNDGDTVIICPKSDQKIKALCLVQNKFDESTLEIDRVYCGINSHPNVYCNYVHRDWNLTFGESLGTIVAKIERDNEKFIMQYRYYVKDIYEWAFHYEDYDFGGLSNILHSFHESKLAQEYLIQGYFEGTLTWNLGDQITERSVALTLFTTLAEKEGGLGNVQSQTWIKSNEIDNFKEYLKINW